MFTILTYLDETVIQIYEYGNFNKVIRYFSNIKFFTDTDFLHTHFIKINFNYYKLCFRYT